MPDHDDVADLDDIDRELKDREIIGVLRRGEIGDVAVDEQFAGTDTDDLVRGDAAIGTADPEILRRLLAFQPLEEFRVGETMRFAQARLLAFRSSSMEPLFKEVCAARPAAWRSEAARPRPSDFWSHFSG